MKERNKEDKGRGKERYRKNKKEIQKEDKKFLNIL